MSLAPAPRHVAIVMDGNGRWAKERNKSRTYGHKQGVLAARRAIEFCLKHDIKALTLFAFGVENFSRPAREVRNLFRLFILALKREQLFLNKYKIKLKIIGNKKELPLNLQSTITEVESKTQDNNALCLNIAVNYSGKWDIIQAANKLRQSNAPIDYINFQQQLALGAMPAPDLFIRTGGVKRLSNFLLWDLAYTELFFSDTLWPDFGDIEFNVALSDFAKRERRFGMTSEQISAKNKEVSCAD